MKTWTQAMREAFENVVFPKQEGDARYNEPKKKHNASDEEIDEAIESTDIYLRAKEHILNAQRQQIGYGLDKYPETLNPHSWTTIETIQHIIEESVDKIHYLTMLQIQLTEQIDNQEVVDTVRESLAGADYDGDTDGKGGYTFGGKPLPFISIHPNLQMNEMARRAVRRKIVTDDESNTLSDRTTATVSTTLTDAYDAIYTVDLNMELQLMVNEGPDVFIERVNKKLQQMKENGQI